MGRCRRTGVSRPPRVRRWRASHRKLRGELLRGQEHFLPNVLQVGRRDRGTSRLSHTSGRLRLRSSAEDRLRLAEGSVPCRWPGELESTNLLLMLTPAVRGLGNCDPLEVLPGALKAFLEARNIGR